MSYSRYNKLYTQSIQNPVLFWENIAKQELEWFAPWKTPFTQNGTSYQWFVDGKINITHNCIDRHITNGRGQTPAFISLGEDGSERVISYQQLQHLVNKMSNLLKSLGVKKGDVVTLYLPHIIEQPVSMLATARMGAIHSVVYGGFSWKALQTRIQEANSHILITADVTYRRGKEVDLLSIARQARRDTSISKTIVLRRLPATELIENEVDMENALLEQLNNFKPVNTSAEDPLFILYTSGTTGKPKGVVHTHGGYNLYTHYTTKINFRANPGDMYWCTADCGWITGHSYVVYGPLSNCMTSVLVEGAPDYPEAGRWWHIIEKYRIKQFYTAPTAIRLLRKYGDEIPNQYDLSSLKILGTVGEPINPDVWNWYNEQIGKGACPIVDTWWQTETGGHMILTLPGMPQKPGIAGVPFYGIEPAIVDKNGDDVPDGEKGFLVIKKPWPSALRTCWNNKERFEQYWSEVGAFYFTGDYAIKDEDGYIQILGRTDDVITLAGYRVGSAELENALLAHPDVAEAAVIGKPDKVKGESIKAYVMLKRTEITDTHGKVTEIQQFIRTSYGKHAIPSEIEFVSSLPKTRSGKIMRRLLKAQELGMEIGDTSTLED